MRATYLLVLLLAAATNTQLTFTSYPQDPHYQPAYPICDLQPCNPEQTEEEEEIDAAEHPIETGVKMAIVGKVLVSVFNCIKGQDTNVDQIFLLSLGLAAITSLVVPSFLKIKKKQQKCDLYAKTFVIAGCLCSEYLRWFKK